MRWYVWKWWRIAWAGAHSSDVRVWDADGRWRRAILSGLFVLVKRGDYGDYQ